MRQEERYRSASFRELLLQYETALSKGETPFLEADELTDLAEYYDYRGQDEQAMRAVDLAIELHPGALEPLSFKAHSVLLRRKDTVEAERLAEQIIDKGDQSYSYLIGEIMLVKKQYEAADSYFKSVLADLMDDEDRQDMMVDVASLFADYDCLDQAERWIDLSGETVAEDVREIRARIALGKGDYEQAKRLYQGLLDDDPYSVFYWNQLTIAQIYSNQLYDAISSCEFALAINPNDVEAIGHLGNTLYALGRYEEALQKFERYTSLKPENVVGHMFLGMTLNRLGRITEALKAYHDAESCADGDPDICREVYQEISLLLAESGKEEEAMAYAGRVGEIIGQTHWETLLLKGHLSLIAKHEEEALELFFQATESGEHDAEVYLQIGITLYDCGFPQLALTYFVMLLQRSDDERKDGYAYMAACCRDLGRMQEFASFLRIACEKNAEEVRLVFSEELPPELSPEQYFDYIMSHPPEEGRNSNNTL